MHNIKDLYKRTSKKVYINNRLRSIWTKKGSKKEYVMLKGDYVAITKQLLKKPKKQMGGGYDEEIVNALNTAAAAEENISQVREEGETVQLAAVEAVEAEAAAKAAAKAAEGAQVEGEGEVGTTQPETDEEGEEEGEEDENINNIIKKEILKDIKIEDLKKYKYFFYNETNSKIYILKNLSTDQTSYINDKFETKKAIIDYIKTQPSYSLFKKSLNLKEIYKIKYIYYDNETQYDDHYYLIVDDEKVFKEYYKANAIVDEKKIFYTKIILTLTLFVKEFMNKIKSKTP